MSRLTATVEGAFTDVGSDPVRPAEIIDKILERHQKDYLRGDGVRQAWAHRDTNLETDLGIRQPAQQWVSELDRLVVAHQQIFGRIAILTLALTDQAVAQSAQNTGLLYALVKEIKPDAISFLSALGVGMLRRRAPIVAVGLGILDPTVELRFLETSPSPLVAVAPQTKSPSTPKSGNG